HCDITNQYINYGVTGGVLLMALFIIALGIAFKYVGRILEMNGTGRISENKLAWALGAALFAQAASSISVSYFDQSIIFLFMNLAVIGSLCSATAQEYRLAASNLADGSFTSKWPVHN